MKGSDTADLRRAIMLQINERLFRDGVISRSAYEQMKTAVVNKVH